MSSIGIVVGGRVVMVVSVVCLTIVVIVVGG